MYLYKVQAVFVCSYNVKIKQEEPRQTIYDRQNDNTIILVSTVPETIDSCEQENRLMKNNCDSIIIHSKNITPLFRSTPEI